MRARILAQLFWFTVWFTVAGPRLSAQLSVPWQPISKEDLALKDNPADPGSAAMILERQLYTDDEKRIQIESLRVKILTNAGRAYANIEIPYRARSTSIEDISGRTVSSDGTVIKFDGTVFDNVIIKYKRFRYDVKTFTLPAVEVGSVIEYSYTMKWKEKLPDYVRNPTGYTFTDGWTIPTATWTIQQELFTRHATFVFRPVKSTSLSWASLRLSEAAPQQQPDGTLRMEFSNIRPIENEEYSPPESVMTSRVHFYYRIGYVGNFWRTHGKTSAEMYQKLFEKTKALEQAAEQIAPKSDAPETRLRKLYARVQQIRYLSYEPSRTEKEIKREHLPDNKSAEDVLHHGYGYGNEINLLFTALARAAGFNASVVQVVDRTSAVFEETVEDASQLDAIIVLVRLNGQDLYFDPATQFCPYGQLPWFENNTSGVRWDKLGGEIVHVDVPTTDNDILKRSADLKLLPDGGIEGILNVEFEGQEAFDRRMQAIDEDEGGRRKLIEDEIKEWLPRGATVDLDSVSGWKTSEEPLRIKCHVMAPSLAVLTRQRMLFPTGIFQMNRKASLFRLNRTLPVYFRHGYTAVDKVSITLPPGYKVEALPEETQEHRVFASFDEKRTAEGNRVLLERHTRLLGFYFRPDRYGDVWTYFRQLKQSDGQRVVIHGETQTAKAQ